ncbi:hypothetical protein AWJ19_09690 [Paenibacillus sp. DMB5]|nr:hypothetical protein AWJ19_09690 [Paenibacillus sp. DMB5]
MNIIQPEEIMNITKLQIVVLIEKYKKVTDVAAELGLKQPTVSFHMKSLESELGTSLFQYRSGRVLLTEAGRALYQYAVRIVSLAVEAERSLKQFSSLNSGNLELEASYIPGTYVLPKIVSQFINLHPGIDAVLSVHNDNTVRERLRSGIYSWQCFIWRRMKMSPSRRRIFAGMTLYLFLLLTILSPGKPSLPRRA